MTDFDGSPAARGFYMPPEWSTHEHCWLAWPQEGTPWMDAIEVARMAFADVARQISRFEPVTMIAAPWQAEEAQMTCGPSVNVLVMPLNDCWSRDFGPGFVVDGEGTTAAVAWRFNGYGNRFAHDLDEFFGEALAASLGMACFHAPLVMEGGAFQVDEFGTFLTTEKVLQSRDRNPTLSVTQIEERLVYFLGARKIIWLPEGLHADRTTDGHIDNILCFAPGGKVLVHWPDGFGDPDRAVMQDVVERLSRETNADGKAFEIIKVPSPDPGLDFEGKPASRSYINFYLANNAVIVPGFDSARDQEAADIIAEAYPGREVVQIDAGPIVFGGGGIHRITQQQPKGKALAPG